jgi:serine/threonine-protein kinase
MPFVVTALVMVSMMVVVTAVLGVRYSNRRVAGTATAAEGGATASAVAPPSTTEAPGTTETTRRPTTTTTTARPPVPTASPDEFARELLNAQVAIDRAAVESLVDRWVPQLSSKRLGLVVHGVRFTHQEIWADFRQTKNRYPSALLLSSADFVSFDSDDFWVTVVPYTHASGAEANRWCDQERIGPDDCFAKRLTHTGTSAGTTVLRR